MSIAERLASVVEEQPFTMTAFADHLGIPYRSLQNYLRGEREPSADALRKLNEKWRVNINWLLTGEGEPSTLDYLDRGVVDKVLIECFRPVLRMCLSKRSPLSRDERVTLFRYAIRDGALGLRSFVDTLLDEELAPDFESLSEWKLAFDDIAHLAKVEQDQQRPDLKRRRKKTVK